MNFSSARAAVGVAVGLALAVAATRGSGADEGAAEHTALEAVTAANASRVDLLSSWAGHTDWARCVAFHPRDPVVASGGKDGAIGLWNVATNAVESIASGHEC